MPKRVAQVCLPVLLTGLLLAGCGRTPEEVPTPTSEGLCQGAVGDGPRIGMAYDVGGRDDRGINDAAFTGLSKAVHDFHATCFEGEAAAGELESARVERLQHFADNGATTIVAVGSRYARAVATVSASYPRIRFALIDATSHHKFGSNVARLNFKAAQAAFLAGAAAALRTKTGTIGYIGAAPLAGAESQDPYEAGYKAGAAAAKPTVSVLVNRLQRDTPEPGKPDGANKTAKAQYKAGADVIFGSARISERALFNAALSSGDGLWVIGTGSNQYRAAKEEHKPVILTSVVKRYDTVTYDFIASVAKGHPLTGRHTYGIKDDGIDYVRTGHFLTKSSIKKLNGFEARIVAGDIQVPDSLG